ncbi:MAG: hypothetical protein AABW56_00800, partial [Nanoarchaeota archaeon]
EKTILKTLEEKIKVEAYPSKVNNLQVIRFGNTLFIPIEDFIFIINLEKPSFDVKVIGNKELVNKAIIKEINKITNDEIKKAKQEYNRRIKQINEEELSLEKKLRKEIKDKVLLNYKIKELNEEKSLLEKASGKELNNKIKEILDEREQVINDLKKIEPPVICPPLEIHKENWCKDGKLIPGKKDINGCQYPDQCIKCLDVKPKDPNWCKYGKIISGGLDENGCMLPYICITETITSTSTSSTTTTSTSTSSSSTSILGLIITTTSTSTSSSTTTISGIGVQVIEGETGRKVNETILYFADIITESDRTNITIEELGIENYEEKEPEEQVSYEGIYNLVLFLIIILILLGIQYKKKKLNILVLSLVVSYTILTLILI